MKVVRLTARLNVGGPAKHVEWVEAGLRRRGVESLLVAGVVPPGEDDMGYFAEGLGVRPIVIPEMSREVSPKDAAAVWKLYRLLRRERPDIVHTHTRSEERRVGKECRSRGGADADNEQA